MFDHDPDALTDLHQSKEGKLITCTETGWIYEIDPNNSEIEPRCLVKAKVIHER